MSNTIALDFETFYNEAEGLGIKQQGTWKYCHDARFDPYLLSVSDGTQSWAGQPKNFNWNALEGKHLVSHNKYFDSLVYRVMVDRGLAPRINFAEWSCTANLSTYLCMRRDLGRACEFLLGVKLDKSVRGEADQKTWDDLTKEDGGKSMMEYARKDAYYCWLLWNKFGHLWPPLERDLSNISINQGQRGMQIDEDKLRRYIALAQDMLIVSELRLPWMKQGKKPTSPKAIAEECRANNIPCPPIKQPKKKPSADYNGEEAYEAWAALYSPRFEWVKAYTDYRVIQKLLGTLETIKERLHPDGVFSYDMLYFGAHTGRWAGAGGFNMQNLRKTAYYRALDGTLITCPNLLKNIEESLRVDKRLPDFVSDVIDIRSIFIARPGKKLLIGDLSQIEPRVLAWLVNDRTMLASMASGQSPYEAHARATMNWNGGEMKKENKELYALAKARVLGLGYGCGWKKFITVAMTMAGLDITENDPEFTPALNDAGEECFGKDGEPLMVSGYGLNSRKIVTDYRGQNPLVTGLWKSLDDSFRDSVGGDFEMTLPSGRKLRYPEVKRERKAVADPENPQRFTHKWVTSALIFDQKRNGVVRKALYGGLLTENLVQATARDIFGEHVVALSKTAGADVLFTAHDEAVTECDQSITKSDIEHVMNRCPGWMEGLPVAAEVVESKCYLK